MKIGNREFDTANNVYLMGILNVTPDSFSDGGRFNHIDAAMFHAEQMILAGTDILDIGGESTRPGYTPISVSEEINRVLPVLEKLKTNFDIPLSLDSYKSEVVQAAGQYIDMVNDIWGFRYDKTHRMAEVTAKLNIPCCLMHNRKEHYYKDFWSDFMKDMREILDIAQSAGIKQDNIILDGGVGFQKTYEENLMVLNRTKDLCALGCPVMIAASNKSVVGLSIDKPVADRIFGTVATSVVGVMKGASFLRVHDIAANLDAIKMTKSIMEEAKWIPSI